MLLIHPAHRESHHTAIGNRVKHVGAAAQDAAPRDVFRNREGLFHQQILGVENGELRRTGGGGSAARRSRDDLRVNDARPGIDRIPADIGGGYRVRELRKIVGDGVEPVLAHHAPGPIRGYADASQRPRRSHDADGEELALARVKAVEGLGGSVIRDAVHHRAVRIRGKRGGDYLRGKRIERHGQGLSQRGECRHRLHSPGNRVEQENSSGSNDECPAIGDKRDTKRCITRGESLPGVIVQVDQRYRILTGVSRSGAAVMGNQQELRIRRDGHRSRLRRDVHRCMYRVVRRRHNFNAVRSEVSDIQ